MVQAERDRLSVPIAAGGALAQPAARARAELTAEDVAFSVRRALDAAGRPAQPLLASLERVEVVDRYTVTLILKTPLSWLPEMVAAPMVLPIVAKECVETFGDLQKAEALVGTGPWQLEDHRRGVGITLTRHADYFRPGLPYIDRIELILNEDNASAAAGLLTGKYDLGWDPPGAIPRSDWVQLRDRLRAQRPGLRTAEILDNSVFAIFMRTDRPPFNDLRVRQAISMAINRQEIIESVLEGAGIVNPPVPAALKEWTLPVDELGPGAACYRFDPREARRLLTQAGHGGGIETTLTFTSYGRVYTDVLQLVTHDLKAIGINAKPMSKEYGAFVSSVPYGNFEGLTSRAFPPRSSLQPPVRPLLPRTAAQCGPCRRPGAHRHARSASGCPRPVETPRDRACLPAPRGEDSTTCICRPESTSPRGTARSRNYAPNISYDYGGRLAAAWLHR